MTIKVGFPQKESSHMFYSDGHPCMKKVHIKYSVASQKFAWKFTTWDIYLLCGFWRPMIWEQLTKVLWLRDSDAIAAKLLVGLMSHSSVLTDCSQARRPGKKGWQRPQHLVQYGWIFRATNSHTYCITHTPLTHLSREGPTWGYKYHTYRAAGLL